MVSVSSSGHHLGDIRWDDPWFTLGYDKWEAYGQSKTANALFAVHLDAVGRELTASAPSRCTPARSSPRSGRHLEAEDLEKVMVRDEQGELVMPEFKTPEQGAATSVWAATAPELEEHGGAYLEDVAVARRRSERRGPGGGEHRGQGLRAGPGGRRAAVGLVGAADRRGRLRG